KNNRNKSNAIAVYKFCAKEYGGVQAALLVEEVLASEDKDFFKGERENQFDNIEDEDLLSAEFDDNFDLAETPLFLGSDYIFSDAK
ncbi:601_t:CDS:2, partial [Gigaspora margarita]